MKKIILFEKLNVEVSDENWNFLCQNRFFTDNPSYENIECEFISGTGITEKKKELWPLASLRFTEYVEDLKEIQQLDINAMAREVLTDEDKYIEFT